MPSNKFLEELSADQKDLGSRIFDLVIGRIFKRAYLGFDGNIKGDMKRIFSSGDDVEREKFVKEHIPGFKKLFEQEAKKIEEEIKLEVENQI